MLYYSIDNSKFLLVSVLIWFFIPYVTNTAIELDMVIAWIGTLIIGSDNINEMEKITNP